VLQLLLGVYLGYIWAVSMVESQIIIISFFFPTKNWNTTQPPPPQKLKCEIVGNCQFPAKNYSGSSRTQKGMAGQSISFMLLALVTYVRVHNSKFQVNLWRIDVAMEFWSLIQKKKKSGWGKVTWEITTIMVEISLYKDRVARNKHCLDYRQWRLWLLVVM